MESHTDTRSTSFGSILVPLDGSPASEAALPVAAELARASGSKVHLARVHTPVVASVDLGFPAPEWDAEILASEEQYLVRVASKFAADTALQADRCIIEGSVGRSIREYAGQVAADLIVMCTHGRTGLNRAWLGSTADWLARFATVPVLLVRPPQDAQAVSVPLLRNVLVPLDGSPRSELILPDAVRLARLRGGRLTLMQVVTPVVPLLEPYASPSFPPIRDEVRTRELMRRAKEHLDAIAMRLRAQHPGLEVATEVIASDATADAILERAGRDAADVVALYTRGRGASRLLVGSVADKVLRSFDGVLLLMGPVAAEAMEGDTLVIEEEMPVGSG